MEIYELKYFLAAAATENLHQAAQNIHISPASISKAIARLEEECQSSFFARVGRGIKITEDGKAFAKKASEIVSAAENLVWQMQGHEKQILVEAAGTEFLMSYFSSWIIQNIKETFPKSRFHFHSVGEDKSWQLLDDQRMHFILTTEKRNGYHNIELTSTVFETVISDDHPEKKKWIRKGKEVPVEELQTHSFVSSTSGLLGQMSGEQSADGWRDDKFPRKIDFVCSSLSAMTQLVRKGQAIAYLPDFVAADHGFHKINVSGCPYSCRKTIYLTSLKRPAHEWVSDFMKGLNS